MISRSQILRTAVVTSIAPALPPSPKRAALIMGLTYGDSHTLRGSANDALAVRETLLSAGKFADHEVKLMTDMTPAGRETLTNAGIKVALSLLACRTHAESLDIVFVYYSGHGTRAFDANFDEADGMDEGLIPEDFADKGMVSDDWLATWVTAINEDTRVVVVFDCCNSGTTLDLVIGSDQKVLYMSSCRDSELSVEVSTDGKTYRGAFTSCLLEVLDEQPDLWDDAPVLYAETVHEMRHRGLTQTPVMRSTYDLGTEPLFL